MDFESDSTNITTSLKYLKDNLEQVYMKLSKRNPQREASDFIQIASNPKLDNLDAQSGQVGSNLQNSFEVLKKMLQYVETKKEAIERDDNSDFLSELSSSPNIEFELKLLKETIDEQKYSIAETKKLKESLQNVWNSN